MDDLLPDGSLSARDLAELGATLPEIAAELEISEREASELQGPVTPAQLRRIEHMTVARAVGMGESLPHVQAQQFMLANHMPDQYGRQAGQGNATLRVVVDRDWTKRERVTHEGEIALALLTPPTPA